MKRRTYAALVRRAVRWLRKGHSVVLDATFGTPDERAGVCRSAARTGAQLVSFTCRAEESELQARLLARAAGPPGALDARPVVGPALRAAFIEPTEMPHVVGLSTAGQPVPAP